MNLSFLFVVMLGTLSANGSVLRAKVTGGVKVNSTKVKTNATKVKTNATKVVKANNTKVTSHVSNATKIPTGCPRGNGVVYLPFTECSSPVDCSTTARQAFNIPGCGCGCEYANCTVTYFNHTNTTTCPVDYRCITNHCLGDAHKANVTVTCSGVCKPLLS